LHPVLSWAGAATNLGAASHLADATLSAARMLLHIMCALRGKKGLLLLTNSCNIAVLLQADTCGDPNGAGAANGNTPYQCPPGQKLKAGVGSTLIEGDGVLARNTACCEVVRQCCCCLAQLRTSVLCSHAMQCNASMIAAAASQFCLTTVNSQSYRTERSKLRPRTPLTVDLLYETHCRWQLAQTLMELCKATQV
jgi:hypothetical protein